MDTVRPRLIGFVAVAGLLFAHSVWAGAACDPQVGRFVSVSGSVDVQGASVGQWQPASLDHVLCEGDTIRVGERSRAAVALINEAVLRLDQNTTMRLLDITGEKEERSWLEVVKGAFQSFSRKPRFLTVNTPYLNGSIEGTEFLVRVDDGAAAITVFEGVVVAANDQGSLSLRPGESAQAAAGHAPQPRLVVKPRDEVQWALYYPPVLSAATAGTTSPGLQDAAQCAATGDSQCAFAALDKVPMDQRDAGFHELSAATLLSVGRVSDARSEIDMALDGAAASAQAYALRSVIAVAQNDRESALADGRKAVDADPDSAAARIALSYALQANTQLESARDTLAGAVQRRPEDALAWARLAEVQMMLGDRMAASDAAQKAVDLQPDLSRTQNVLGFAALVEFKVDQAQAAFERAIELDSADPLPHLGLGLAKIRRGDLAAGRGELEAAVALDGNNALLRAYLGKAYFEEKRGPLDAQQFEISKQLDPMDPTAYFYNAIRLQTENQPVGALRELNEAIAHNDNRAVYRGRLLLDRDRAARGASLARVFNDLGFKQLGVAEAARSLTTDPGNASAHRFLSDTYLGIPRHGIARVSELLQAQLMQESNVSAIQPSLADVNFVSAAQGGPATAGLNEYTPLFQRDGMNFNAGVKVGTNKTQAVEATVSGAYGPASFSAGGFDYESDGWRPNNRLEQTSGDFFVQWAVTPNLNLQAEYLSKSATWGDLSFNWDPEAFTANTRTDRDSDTWRLGARFTLSPQASLLLSYVNSELNDEKTQEFQLSPIAFGYLGATTQDDGAQWEAQYLRQGDRYNLVVGGAYYDIERTQQQLQWVELGGSLLVPPGVLTLAETNEDITQPRAYLYGNFQTGSALTWTAGFSYDNYEEGDLSVESFNPKLGVRWRVQDGIELRAAAFKVVKPALVSNRTIEPTEVAGFNQFFDDTNGTKAWRYGVGMDWRLSQDVSMEAELTWREIDSPVMLANTWHIDEYDEQLHRLQLNWTPDSRVAVTAAAVYDRFESGLGVRATAGNPIPTDLQTFSIPLGITYTDPSGLFGTLGVSYVNQDVERVPTSTLQGDDDFVLVDLSVGQRLPKRYGVLSLGVRNLFDRSFHYQDDSFRAFGAEDPYRSLYVPERTAFGSLTLNF